MKNKIKSLLYHIGLASFIEILRFRFIQIKNLKKNRSFKKAHQNLIIPPDFYLYETFGLDYKRFIIGGRKTAQWILDSFEKYLPLDDKSILDWGCGSGRIIAHLHELNNSIKIYGTDYNDKYVDWCNQNIANVIVKKNDLAPPLDFEKESFNAIYGISIFTHLSLEMHKAWLKELNRVTKKGGLLLITTHGKASKVLLNKKQVEDFDNNLLVVQNYKVEGNRLYAAYQPKLFFRELSNSLGFDILEHIEGKVINGKMNQDVWILKKR